MEMKLQFPADAPQVLSKLFITDECGTRPIYLTPRCTVSFTLHTPDGAFTYTIDNARKTLTTESDSPFLA